MEYDWLRTFWDLRTDYSISFDLLMAALVASDPDTWNAKDSGAAADFPFARMQAGALAEGFLANFNTCAGDNGVDH